MYTAKQLKEISDNAFDMKYSNISKIMEELKEAADDGYNYIFWSNETNNFLSIRDKDRLEELGYNVRYDNLGGDSGWYISFE